MLVEGVFVHDLLGTQSQQTMQLPAVVQHQVLELQSHDSGPLRQRGQRFERVAVAVDLAEVLLDVLQIKTQVVVLEAEPAQSSVRSVL